MLGLGGSLLFYFVRFGFLMGILAGLAVTEVLRRYGSAGNLLLAGLVAAGVAWVGASALWVLVGGQSLAFGIQAHALESIIAAGVVWWRLR